MEKAKQISKIAAQLIERHSSKLELVDRSLFRYKCCTFFHEMIASNSSHLKNLKIFETSLTNSKFLNRIWCPKMRI